ncbi:hypothetical protein [Nioella aestuarii]|uniref:hypothetical protein n=1 Tax=Nioella aestuarii TaxID=1662864 RepID=UPI003D7FE2BB
MIIKRLAMGLPLLLASWLLVLTLVMRFSDAAPGAVVLFPPAGFVANLPADLSVVAASSFTVTLVSERPDMARRLYSAGAPWVLPAGLPGCLPLPAPR